MERTKTTLAGAPALMTHGSWLVGTSGSLQTTRKMTEAGFIDRVVLRFHSPPAWQENWHYYDALVQAGITAKAWVLYRKLVHKLKGNGVCEGEISSSTTHILECIFNKLCVRR